MDEKKSTNSKVKKDDKSEASKWGSANDFFKTDINDTQSEWEKIRKDRERKKSKESQKPKQ